MKFSFNWSACTTLCSVKIDSVVTYQSEGGRVLVSGQSVIG